MKRHDKLTFTAEYCRSIRIAFRIRNDALFIKSNAGNYCQVCFNLYNLSEEYIIKMINEYCDDCSISRYNK